MGSNWMPGANRVETAARGGYGIPAGQMRPNAAVMHTMEGFIATMRQRARERPVVHQTSYTFGIGLDGDVDQYVGVRTPAWHAGRLDSRPPTWRLYRPGVNPNAHTIGVSAEGRAVSGVGPTNVPLAWTDAQVESAQQVLRWAGSELGIEWGDDTLTAHSQIAVLTRLDPGPRWPKQRVLEALAATPPEQEEDMDYHVVRPLQTLTQVAALHRMTVQRLAELNGITNIDQVEAWQPLRLHAGVPRPPLLDFNPAVLSENDAEYLLTRFKNASTSLRLATERVEQLSG